LQAFAPPFRIEVQFQPKHWPKAYRIGLDCPLNGSITNAFSTELAGFILLFDKDPEFGKPEFLEFKIEDTIVWRCPIKLPREDLLRSEEFFGLLENDDIYCGFNTVLPSFFSIDGRALQLEVALQETKHGRKSFQLATIRFVTANEITRPKFQGLSVLTINSIGRSGSSLLCKILDGLPNFCVPKLFGQFGEVSIVSYYLRAIAVLSSEGAAFQVNSFEPFADFLGIPNGYLRIDPVTELASKLGPQLMDVTRESMMNLFSDVMNQVKTFAHASKPGSSFWVEKSWNYISANIGSGLVEDMREIFLVRDIRTFWRSQYAFQKKLLTPDVEINRHIDGTFDKYVNMVNHFESAKSRICLVRYEELIEYPVETIGRVFAFLGLEFDDQCAETVRTLVSSNDDHARYMKTEGHVIPEEFEIDQRLQSLPVERQSFIRKKLEVLGYTI
jgi:Sulfotransferase family